MIKRLASLSALVLAVAAAWMLVLPVAPVAQPISFNHNRHGALACVVCHPGAEEGIRAGLPGGAVCAGCHATAPPGAAASAAWDELLAAGEPGWRRVTHMPDHVAFSHRRHVGLAGLECASCHAGIGQLSAPPPRAPISLDMDACVSCHRKEGASEDCAACHR